MVWIPTFLANQQVEDLGLNDLFAQRLQLELLPTAVAHGDAELARGEAITH
jgi:hypothetical protein